MSVPPYALAVCIGRFQPFHLGHRSVLVQALAQASRCLVLLGSAHQARTPAQPWTWQERAEMLRQALPEELRERVEVQPLRDHHDEQRWADSVRALVAAALPEGGRVLLAGHFKDASSAWVRDFPQWKLWAVPGFGAYDARTVRDALLGAGADGAQAALLRMAPLLHANTQEFLRDWLDQGHLPALVAEWQALARGRAEWAGSPYPPVFVTVDAVIRCQGRVLLIRRGQAPGLGLLAVPGGFLEQRDTVYQSAVRELEEETGLAMLEPALRQCLKAVAVFDRPDRSQRGRVITHAHYFDLGERALPAVQAGDDARDAQWVPIAELAELEPQFHDDHFQMLDHFLGVLRP
ncbi:NUDIX domain-containing protein [Pseudorhodoferax soli]|uniref:Bifunctional NMN adenylyltransferase/nudix hydrolase n=1 Tax=Pseudorhodoferax soli TaxID=545864 RepID=A0A368XKI9_9BURK|nr:NUDIX domain-containing protein [Pseudorhodoferax soli]RCW67558.1 bifunctional NMN adenylyltransferase/nudix hydrolase [Pseudorhodoferax soli]